MTNKFGHLYERIGKFQVFIILLTIMILLGTLSTLIGDSLKKSFDAGSEHYNYIGTEDQKWLFQNEDKQIMTIEDLRSDQFGRLSQLKIVYNNHTLKRIFSNDAFNTYTLYLDEKPIFTEDLNQSFVDSHQNKNTKTSTDQYSIESQIMEGASNVVEYVESNLVLKKWIAVIILMLFGVFELIYPEFSWHLRKHFLDTNSEPSNAYCVKVKVCGLILVAIGIILPHVALPYMLFPF